MLFTLFRLVLYYCIFIIGCVFFSRRLVSCETVKKEYVVVKSNCKSHQKIRALEKKKSKTTRKERERFAFDHEEGAKERKEDESDGVIAVEMARPKRGPGVFGQSRRRGRIRLFPKSLGERDAHVYI